MANAPSTPWYARKVTQGFKWTRSDQGAHSGIDLACPMNTPLTALLPGKVLFAGFKPWGGQVSIQSEVAGVGAVVISYLHLSSIAVEQGNSLLAGAPVGLSGTPPLTGPYAYKYGNGPHLHFETTAGHTPPYIGHAGPSAPDGSYPISPKFLLDAAASGKLANVNAGGILFALNLGGLQQLGDTATNAFDGSDGFWPLCEAIHQAETFAGWQPLNPFGSIVNNGTALTFRAVVVLIGLALILAAIWNAAKDMPSAGQMVGINPQQAAQVAGMAAMAA